MKHRPLWPLLPPLALLLFAGLFYIYNWLIPIGSTCGVRKFTGLHCPGCGGTRSARDLLRGQFLDALSHNALVVSGLGFLLLGIGYLIVRMTILGKPAPRIPQVKASWIGAVIITILMFTILRNIPAWPFSVLAP